MTQRIPGPKPLPLLGSLPRLLRDTPRFFTELTRDYGDVVSFRLGLNDAVLINDPRLISQLVRDRACPRSRESRRMHESFLGDGLLSLEGPTHLRHRRLMAPAFHRERIREYGTLMSRTTYAELATWQPPQLRNLHDNMLQLSFAIVSQALFTADVRSEAEEVGTALELIVPWATRGSMLAGFLPEWVPFMYPRHVRAAINRLQKLVTEIVTRRRSEGGDCGDLLSMLLATHDEGGSALSDEDIAAEALTILMAGHDTTANTLSWAWHLLTQHVDVQEAVAEEVQRAVGARPVTPDDLPQLPLVEQVIQETLRLYPIVWAGIRVPQRDSELGGHKIRAGTSLVFSMLVTQRDPRYFPEPERFDPARFSPERSGSIPEGAYMPFGAGFHKCIGNAFALMELRLMLAAMAQRFSFRAVPGHRVREKTLIVLTMKDAFPVTIVPRPGISEKNVACASVQQA